MASFSNAGCNQATGVSVAAQQTLSSFTELKAGAASLLEQALGMALSIEETFSKASVNDTFDQRIQFDDWQPPDLPIPDYSEYEFNTPKKPSLIGLEDVTDVDIDANLPPLNGDLILKYINLLCDVLANMTDGLPVAFVDGIKYRMKNRVDSHINGQKLCIADDYQRRGWTIPNRAIQPRIDALTHLNYRLQAFVVRDFRIHVYEMAVEVFKAVLSAAMSYFKSWAKIYESYIDAQSTLANNQARQNELTIAELRLAVELFEARSMNERSRLQVLSQDYGIDAAVYASCISEGGAFASRDLTAAGLEGGRRTAEGRDAVSNADESLRETMQNVQESVSNIENVLATLGRLMAAHYQALRTGASANSAVSSSTDKSCGTSYRYSETLST